MPEIGEAVPPGDDRPPMTESAPAALPDTSSDAVVTGPVEGAARHPLLRWWSWPIVVTVVFLAMQPLIGGGWGLFPDSYRYAKQAEIYLGHSETEAHELALDAFCESVASHRTYQGSWIPLHDTPEVHQQRVDKCFDTYRPRGGDVTTTDPRYQSIFSTRPGYPLLATPFVGAFGISNGLRLLGLVIAAAGGIAVYAVLRIGRLRPLAAAAGQVAYLVSPLGWWALQALGEGLVNLCVIGALGGILLLRASRMRPGALLLAASFAVLGVVRFSSVLLVGLALALACALTAWWVDGQRPEVRRHSLIGAGCCALAALVTVAAMPILGLPGAEVTLQDTFTRHFADPLVPDPWHRLAAANVHFWPEWLSTPSKSWLLLGCLLAAAAILAIWRRDLMWFALGLAGAGWAHVAAHPLPREAERLGLLLWMPAVVGLAVAVQVVSERLHRRGEQPLAKAQ